MGGTAAAAGGSSGGGADRIGQDAVSEVGERDGAKRRKKKEQQQQRRRTQGIGAQQLLSQAGFSGLK